MRCATHGARATQLFSRSRAHSRERARCAHTGAQQIDAQRSRLMAHSLLRLECRLPLMANTGGQQGRFRGSGMSGGELISGTQEVCPPSPLAGADAREP